MQFTDATQLRSNDVPTYSGLSDSRSQAPNFPRAWEGSPGFESQLCLLSHVTLGKSLFFLGLYFLISVNDNLPIMPHVVSSNGKTHESA